MKRGAVCRTFVLCLLAVGATSAAAGEAAPPAPEGATQVTTKRVARRPEEPAPTEPERQPPFVPIVGGRLLSHYRRYPLSDRRRRFLWSSGLYLPFGGYLHAERYAYDPYLFEPEDFPLERSRRVLVVVEPTDAPGSVYYYSDSFPYYYGQPGYFPANRYGQQYVTVISPTVPGGRQPEKAAASDAEARVPRELAEAGFVSTLSPLLGGPGRVSVGFAVGELKLHRGDYEGAAAAFGRAVGEAPDEPAPKIALGLALAGQGDYVGAAQVIKRGLRGMPDWRDVRFGPAQLFADPAAYEAILNGLKAAESRDKTDQDVQFVLGFLHLAGERYLEAVAHLAQAGLEDPLVLGLMLEASRQARAQSQPE